MPQPSNAVFVFYAEQDRETVSQKLLPWLKTTRATIQTLNDAHGESPPQLAQRCALTLFIVTPAWLDQFQTVAETIWNLGSERCLPIIFSRLAQQPGGFLVQADCLNPFEMGEENVRRRILARLPSTDPPTITGRIRHLLENPFAQLALPLLTMIGWLIGAGGFMIHRARETILGIDPLSYDGMELVYLSIRAVFSLLVNGVNVLLARVETLQICAFVLLLLTALNVLAWYRAARRPGFALLILLATGLVLWRGADYYAIAVYAENPASPRTNAWTPPIRDGTRANDIAHETHSWMVHPNHRSDRKDITGLLFWFLAAVAIGLAALIPMRPNGRMAAGRFALIASYIFLFLVLAAKFPRAYAYAEWGLEYPTASLEATYLTYLDNHQHIAEGMRAGQVMVFDVSEGGSPLTLWVLGGEFGQGKPSYITPGPRTEGVFAITKNAKRIMPIVADSGDTP